MSALKQRITEDMKAAMKAGDKPRLSIIRLMLAAIKQREIDERIVLDDAQALTVLDKMLKQRQDSAQQYETAKRQDLAERERFEITVIRSYMPQPLSDPELEALVTAALQKAGATSMRDMGKVMSLLRPEVQGRADMSLVSHMVKQRLG